MYSVGEEGTILGDISRSVVQYREYPRMQSIKSTLISRWRQRCGLLLSLLHQLVFLGDHGSVDVIRLIT